MLTGITLRQISFNYLKQELDQSYFGICQIGWQMIAAFFTFSVILFYVDINAGKPEKRVATTPTIG